MIKDDEMAGSSGNSNYSNSSMYLPPDVWSPRYDATFYTVKVVGFARKNNLDDVESVDATATMMIPGKLQLPAYYYKIVVCRQHESITLLRRYSQFQWLHQQLTQLLATLSKSRRTTRQLPTNNDHVQLPPPPLPAQITCAPFQWWQDDAFALTRQQDLADFVATMLEQQPDLAHRSAAVATFFGL